MQNTLKQISQLLKSRRIGEAEALCKRLTASAPQSEHGWIQLGRVCQMKGDLQGMLANAQKAVKVAPLSLLALLQEAEAISLNGDIEGAIKKLINLEKKAAKDARILQHVAEHFSSLGDYQAAMRCYKQAHSVIGDDAGLLYNTATAATALGDTEGAEELLNRVIAKDPHDYAAYYNRAGLSKQTKENNHIPELEGMIEGALKSPGAEAQLGYALAKEYEDLEDYAKSFDALKRGADCRKRLLSYNVADDIETMTEIASVMQGDFFDTCAEPTADAGPIFILGQPRSGTTLVDRILSSHSSVESLGEINDFVIAFMGAAGDVKSKTELVQKTTDIDFSSVGDAYRTSTAGRGIKAPYLIDKTPANFLYIGLIAKALPKAKIIHLRRNPMDSCYAMYKTLFRMGYPFSYSQEDLGAYYVAYHDLMAHWRRELPGRILDVDYEELVTNQEEQSKRLIAHCGLEWQEACLDFHNNKSASATASAAQVRQPIYTSSVEKWRHYEKELAPLKNILENASIAI